MPIEITDDIHQIRLTGLPTWKINCYVVEMDDKITLIDAGTPLNTPTIERELLELGYTPMDIDNILITHYDLDHFGGILRMNHGAKVYAGLPDADYLSGRDKPPLLHHKGAFHRFLMNVTPSIDVNPIRDGDEIDGFEAIHTPGHNPGHMSYIHKEIGAGFLGDLIWFKEDNFTTPFWFDSYDLDEINNSIKKLARQAPRFETACCGHGKPFTNGNAKQSLQEFAETL